MAKRVCAEVGCPTLVERDAYRGRCPRHQRSHDRDRGTKAERGYGSTVHDTPLGRMAFDQCRRAYQRMGDLTCWRCGQPLLGQPWALGHDDFNRGVIRGPECIHCNSSAAGKMAHHFGG